MKTISGLRTENQFLEAQAETLRNRIADLEREKEKWQTDTQIQRQADDRRIFDLWEDLIQKIHRVSNDFADLVNGVDGVELDRETGTKIAKDIADRICHIHKICVTAQARAEESIVNKSSVRISPSSSAPETRRYY